ncbi:hypothetical protein [Lactiplantibacillus argentoratensis]|uniref:Uncharacterized protein n=1 Tax=Lactiplantibacillus argentoratensis TaxID=271881 RepID=A0AAN1UIR9_9LACO|nr:hypothetical protein [Lactiplantibacillus argentoratensis]AYJ36052.1 hypothetical protein LPA65_09900 [Lactiplantibacillus argentoratensis]AYJ36105.1 hypothetical protein LPA65_10215 [Lactiplantibacillus argentoratensis]AYJ36154.1 hypothetical protein LPA65_10530 [Lactiplantibacillus argentoratensis]GEO53957.1 hypothetical protein LPL03_20530 [Lactiplantibacillus argentoratensis]
MAKMINTKYGYVTPKEAEMDAHLDKWMKRRAKQHGAFSLDKNKKDGNYYEQSIVEKVKH